MTIHANRELSLSDAEGWRRRLSPYQRPNDWRSLLELVATVPPLGLAWLAMLIALQFHLYWLYGLLLFPAAGLLIRLIFQEPGFWCTERRCPEELCTTQAGFIFNATTFVDDEQHASRSSGLPVVPR